MTQSSILVADIGGTFSRFAVFQVDATGPKALLSHQTLRTNDYESLPDLVSAAGLFDDALSIDAADSVVLAVPGPVAAGMQVELANVKWIVDREELQHRYPASRVFLINDFVAQAYGVMTPAVATAIGVKTGRRQAGAVFAVVGAGTGLGHCCLIPGQQGVHMALPSEAAHVAFPFSGEEELRYLSFLRATTHIDVPTGDLVVSGRGLGLLHQYLTGEAISSKAVVRRIGPDSPTTHWFARFYARAARHYTLAVLPLSGLYISGGVAARNPFLVDNDTWRMEFTASAEKEKLLSGIAVDLITDLRVGLWGAANFAASQMVTKRLS